MTDDPVTSLSQQKGPGESGRLAPVLTIAAVVTHALVFVGLHLLEPQVDPRSGLIGDYSQTESAVLGAASFAVFAMVWLGLAIGLREVAPGSISMRVGRWLFVMASVAITAGVVFPSAMDPRDPSTLAAVQNVVARPGLFLGIVLVSVGLRAAPCWSDLWPKLLALAVAALATLVVTLGVLVDRDLGGVGQRLVFVLVYSWTGLVSLRLFRV